MPLAVLKLEPFHNMLAPTSEVSKLRYGVPYVNPDSLTLGPLKVITPSAMLLL
ncbi:MAG: hypothetical protein R2865_05580 [Deinococcales bacterium]